MSGCGKPGHVTAGSDEGTQWCATCVLDDKVEEIRKRYDKAMAMINALCQPHGTEGSREWLMSIPARPDYDPDLVIAESLRDIPLLLTMVEAARNEANQIHDDYKDLGSHIIPDAEREERLIGAAEAYLRVTWATHSKTRTAETLRAAIEALKAQKAPH